MGKRNKQFEEERVASCNICGGDIPIDFYMDRGDIVNCDECGEEFVLQSRKPVRLSLLVDDSDDYLNFDDDYYGRD